MARQDAGLEIVSVGDLVREGTYRIHSRFRRAVNLTDGVGLVTVVVPEIGAGPLNIVVRGLAPLRIERLRVGRGVVDVNDSSLPYDSSRVTLSGIELARVDFGALRRQLGELEQILVELSPPKSLAFLLAGRSMSEFRPGFERSLARHASQCVHDILGHDLLRGIECLAGCGFGLTPSGDDFIAGVLTAMTVIERTTGMSLRGTREDILNRATTSNAVSHTLLSLAAAGRASASVRNLIEALGCGSQAEVRSATESVLAEGSTSGADFAVGLCLFLRSRLLAGTPPFAAQQ
jgi:hypothetical protein